MANNNGSGVTLTIPNAYLYYLYGALLLVDVVLAYVAKLLPSTYGLAGLGVLTVTFSGALSHDFEDAHSPANVPTWVTYLVVVIVGALIMGLGTLTADTTLTLAGALGLAITILGAIYHSVAEDAGASAPQYVETVVLAITGGGVSFLAWLAQNPTASWTAILATLVAVASQYVHITGSSVTVSVPSGSAPPPAAVGSPARA